MVNLFLGFSSSNIDNLGHLGGLAGGSLYAWFAGPSYGIGENIFGENVIVKETKKIFQTAGLILFLALFLVGLGFLLQ